MLYIGYWGANDGLSQSTINPHLQILMEFNEVSSLTYISLERDNEKKFLIPKNEKLIHVPLHVKNFNYRFLNKIFQFTYVLNKITRIAVKERFKYIICRSSLAGIFGLRIFRKTGIPFIVESFEPHGDYMVESGIWKKYGLSYLLQKYWEKKQLKYALGIITVSFRYQDELVRKQFITEDRVYTNPCAVDHEKFQFSYSERLKIRHQYKIPEEAAVGIYVGKFGGIYFSLEDSLNLFNRCFKAIGNFYLFILTSQKEVISSLWEEEYKDRVFCLTVNHDEVPSFLSASDFGFSLHSPTPSKAFVSPIKNGEYWANGLPIIISDNIGDDSKLVKEDKRLGRVMGGLFDGGNYALEIVNEIKRGNKRENLIGFQRDFQLVNKTYKNLLCFE